MKVWLQAVDANEEERIDVTTGHTKGFCYEVEARGKWSRELTGIEASLKGSRLYPNYRRTDYYAKVTFDQKDVIELVAPGNQGWDVAAIPEASPGPRINRKSVGRVPNPRQNTHAAGKRTGVRCGSTYQGSGNPAIIPILLTVNI